MLNTADNGFYHTESQLSVKVCGPQEFPPHTGIYFIKTQSASHSSPCGFPEFILVHTTHTQHEPHTSNKKALEHETLRCICTIRTDHGYFYIVLFRTCKKGGLL